MGRLPAILLFSAAAAGVACGEEVTIGASKDNTLYETVNGSRSNGIGILFFVGRSGSASGFQKKRGVMAFDVAKAVPAGSTIESASLSIRLYNAAPGSGQRTMTLHRLLGDWGEGTSNGLGSGGNSTPGDATWLHRFYPDVFWATQGGDFAPDASNSITVNDFGYYTFSSNPQMVADVQGWLDDPGGSFGWIFIGDETDTHTSKAPATREIKDGGASTPKLTIVYTLPPTGDCDEDGDVDRFDYEQFLDCFTGPHAGPPAEGCACVDLDGDGDVDLHDHGKLQDLFTGE